MSNKLDFDEAHAPPPQPVASSETGAVNLVSLISAFEDSAPPSLEIHVRKPLNDEGAPQLAADCSLTPLQSDSAGSDGSDGSDRSAAA